MNVRKLIITTLALCLSIAPLVSSAQVDVGVDTAAGINSGRGSTSAKVKATTTVKTNNAASTTTRATTTAKVRLNEVKSRIEENRQQRIIKHIKNTYDLYTKRLNNIEDLSKRVDSRIAKFESASTTASASSSISLAKTANASAKLKIEAARKILTEINLDATAAVSSTTPNKSLPALLAKFTKAKEAIKAAHAEVVKAIRALKNAEEKNKVKTNNAGGVNATTSATTTASTTNQ